MKQLIGRIISSLIASVFISVIMFVVGLSVVTRKFPPDFGQIQASYENLQKMSQIARQQLAQISASGGMTDEHDIADLARLNEQRAAIGKELLAEQTRPQVAQEIRIPPAARVMAPPPENDLKEQVRELQNQLFRLQQRVNVLESERK